MDKKKSLLNISISILSRIVLLILSVFVRRLLIIHIGNEVNGLNSLYTGIIGMLSVAELGVGSAIVFSMYKPILDGDNGKVSALYCLYRKLYRIIGAIILAIGIVVMPFLPNLIEDYDMLDVNVYLTYFITLISVVISYAYSAKTSLIEAYKDNYITTGIITVSRMVKYLLQTAAILIWESYTAYLICLIIETLVIWGLTEVAVRRTHADIIAVKADVDKNTGTEISRNIKAMFMHKIGGVLCSAVDSLIISSFIGVVILGKYTNYTMILDVMFSFIILLYSPLTSAVGHLCAAGDPDESIKYFRYFHSINYAVGVVFFLGYFAVINSLVAFCFGSDLEISKPIVFVITLNGFTQYMRQSIALFRDASGTFYYDRWRPIIEGIANLILSLTLVNILPERFKIVGVILATIITTIFICDIIEPFVVFKHLFKRTPEAFYIRNYTYIAGFIIALIILMNIAQTYDNKTIEFFKNGFTSIGISISVLVITAIIDKAFRGSIIVFIRKIRQ